MQQISNVSNGDSVRSFTEIQCCQLTIHGPKMGQFTVEYLTLATILKEGTAKNLPKVDEIVPSSLKSLLHVHDVCGLLCDDTLGLHRFRNENDLNGFFSLRAQNIDILQH
jgi:hypothetical protein